MSDLTMLQLELEVLLDIRELLQNPPVTVKDEWEAPGAFDNTTYNTTTTPVKDELYDDAVKWSQDGLKGKYVSAKDIMIHFNLPYYRAGAIMDQLLAAGIIRKEPSGRYKVV